MWIKTFENFKNEDITAILKNLPFNKEFLKFISYIHNETITEITADELINGYCNEVKDYVLFYLNNTIGYKINTNYESLTHMHWICHAFIKYNNRYFDACDYNGVDNIWDLKYFKNCTKINNWDIFLLKNAKKVNINPKSKLYLKTLI